VARRRYRARTRSLHVALSSLRRFLGAQSRRAAIRIERSGAAYSLSISAEVQHDVRAFTEAFEAGRTAHQADQLEKATEWFMRATEIYSGELLPEEGPAEWLVAERDLCRCWAAEAAQALAEIYMTLGESSEAVSVCEWGLSVDRYRDAFWKLLIQGARRVRRAGLCSPAAPALREPARGAGRSPRGCVDVVPFAGSGRSELNGCDRSLRPVQAATTLKPRFRPLDPARFEERTKSRLAASADYP
jgi:hypothetical protein